jgi:hypothetical protein
VLKCLRRLSFSPFETSAGVAAFVVGIGGFFSLPVSVVQEAVPDLARLWSLGYACGGVLIVWGLGTGRRMVEVVGLLFLGAGATISGISVAVLAESFTEAPIVISRLVFAIASMVRIQTIVKGEDIIHVPLSSVKIDIEPQDG